MAAALTAFAAFNAPSSRADHNSNCQVRLAKADHKLHEAIEHHGYRAGRPSMRAKISRKPASTATPPTTNGGMKTDSRWHSDRDWKDEDHEHYREHDEHP